VATCPECQAPIDPEIGECLVCSPLFNPQGLPPEDPKPESDADKVDTRPPPKKKRFSLARSVPIRVPVGKAPTTKAGREAAIANWMRMDLDDGPNPFAGPRPWFVLLVIVMVIVAGMGLLIALSGNFWGEDEIPEIKLASTRTSEFTYRVTVTKASPKVNLNDFSFNLKDGFKLVYQTGKLGLQNTSGLWEGVDVTWDDSGLNDGLPGNGNADRIASAGGPYEDPFQAQVRIHDVMIGGQGNTSYQRSEGAISVAFTDANLDGTLSYGDQFTVQGHSGFHPANDNHLLEIWYDPEAEMVGKTKLGTSKIFTPHINLESIEDSNGTYHVNVVDTTEDKNLTFFQFYLKDSDGTTVQHGEIALQYLGDEWKGIDITWDDDGIYDANPSNGIADRNKSAGEPFSDPRQAQARINVVKSHNESGKPLSVSFIDKDQNGKLTAGDEFLVLGNNKDHPVNDDYIFDIKHDMNYETAGSIRMG